VTDIDVLLISVTNYHACGIAYVHPVFSSRESALASGCLGLDTWFRVIGGGPSFTSKLDDCEQKHAYLAERHDYPRQLGSSADPFQSHVNA
jgi:hypothetical protein